MLRRMKLQMRMLLVGISLTAASEAITGSSNLVKDSAQQLLTMAGELNRLVGSFKV